LHLQQQWDADAELARRLAHEDDDEDDDDDGTMFTPESEDEELFTAEMLAEQQNLWAAFAAQTEDDTEQEAFARRLQEKIAAEEEQEELARRIQEEWDRQEREDREYAERLMEEQRREEEEELEEVRRIAEEIERKERMADCVVCTEEFEKEVLLMLPCEHAYCEGCLRRITPIPAVDHISDRDMQARSSWHWTRNNRSDAVVIWLISTMPPATSTTLLWPLTN
jgi:hypothetical protein